MAGTLKKLPATIKLRQAERLRPQQGEKMLVKANELFLKAHDIPDYWNRLELLLNTAQSEKRLGKMLKIALENAEAKHEKSWTYHIFNLTDKNGKQWAVENLKEFINNLLIKGSSIANSIKSETIQQLCDWLGKYNFWNETEYNPSCGFVYSDIITDASYIKI